MDAALTARRRRRLTTWYYFAGCVLAGLLLEKSFHEMHVSKLLFFAGIWVWARELGPPLRWVLLGMVGVLWLMILASWWQYRTQQLIPLKDGSFRIENS